MEFKSSLEKNFADSMEFSDTLLLDYPTPILLAKHINNTLFGHSSTELKILESKVEPVAVLNMACRLPRGCSSIKSFWELLLDSDDGVVEIPYQRFDWKAIYNPDIGNVNDSIYTNKGGFIDHELLLIGTQLFNTWNNDGAAHDR